MKMQHSTALPPSKLGWVGLCLFLSVPNTIEYKCYNVFVCGSSAHNPPLSVALALAHSRQKFFFFLNRSTAFHVESMKNFFLPSFQCQPCVVAHSRAFAPNSRNGALWSRCFFAPLTNNYRTRPTFIGRTPTAHPQWVAKPSEKPSVVSHLATLGRSRHNGPANSCVCAVSRPPACGWHSQKQPQPPL